MRFRRGEEGRGVGKGREREGKGRERGGESLRNGEVFAPSNSENLT